MSLVGFHRVLITTAILFCLAFGAWQAEGFTEGGGWLSLLLAALFGASGIGLLVYLLYLDRFLGRQDEQ